MTPAARAGAAQVTPMRHLAWLVGGLAVSFLVPYLLADQLELPRDLHYAIYIATVLALFLGWVRDTGQSLHRMVQRRRRWAVGLGLVFAPSSALLATRAEGTGTHPTGLELVGALLWRGVAYGAADGLLLSAFPIIAIAPMTTTPLLRRRRRLLVVFAAFSANHAGYSDYRSQKLAKALAGDLVWSAPTLLTLNPIGAPIAHVGLHVSAVLHNSDTELFLPPHTSD